MTANQDDALPEDDSAEVLSADTLAAIEEGLDDIRNGRTISLEEYRRSRGL